MAAVGVDRATRLLVIARDSGQCQFCGRDVDGLDYSLQHRRARGMGGSRDPRTNDPSNLVLMCGSATTGCHGYVEQHRQHAIRRGFNVPQAKDPATIALQDWRGDWWFLNPDGTRDDWTRPPAGGQGVAHGNGPEGEQG